MLHPIFSTAIQRPDLIAEHIAAYSAVISQDANAVKLQVMRRAIAGGMAVICGSVFLSMMGTAVMLGFIQNQFSWALVIVPGIALLLTVVAVFKAVQPLAQGNFSELKAQLKSDVDALRMAS